MRGKPQAAYKRIQRFLRRVDPRQALADVTEVECPQARKPPLWRSPSGGPDTGLLALLLPTPYRGRALPGGFLGSSSRTMTDTADARTQNHWRAVEELKGLVGDRPSSSA